MKQDKRMMWPKLQDWARERWLNKHGEPLTRDRIRKLGIRAGAVLLEGVYRIPPNAEDPRKAHGRPRKNKGK